MKFSWEGRRREKGNPMWGHRKFKITANDIWWLYMICSLTIVYIARRFDTSPRLIYNYMKEFGIETKGCKFGSTGKDHCNWKGGKARQTKGYIYERCDGHPNASKSQYVLQHRLVAEKAIGRYLKTDEIIHHINGNRLDNRNCNLLICSRKYHNWLESKMANLYKQENFA